MFTSTHTLFTVYRHHVLPDLGRRYKVVPGRCYAVMYSCSWYDEMMSNASYNTDQNQIHRFFTPDPISYYNTVVHHRGKHAFNTKTAVRNTSRALRRPHTTRSTAVSQIV